MCADMGADSKTAPKYPLFAGRQYMHCLPYVPDLPLHLHSITHRQGTSQGQIAKYIADSPYDFPPLSLTHTQGRERETLKGTDIPPFLAPWL